MASTSSSSTLSQPTILLLTHNSLRNDTYNCDWAGIHFRVSTPTDGIKTERITSIYRWDKRLHEEVLVAEWERNFTKDKFKFLKRADMPKDFQPVKEVFPRTWGYPYGGYTCVHTQLQLHQIH